MTNIYYEAKVIELAQQIHKDDRYGDDDYMYHLRSVFDVAMDMYGLKWARENVDLIYLHDAIEDHPECKTNLSQQLDKKVIAKLEALNKDNFDNRREYLMYIKQFYSGDVLKVKICDTISNLQESVKIGDMKRVKRYAWQLNYLLED